MEKIYCIYTNEIVDASKASPEHIIPLALGGCNEFVIKVDAIKNSELGSKIDGKLANDFLMSLIRSKNNFKGHSKKKVSVTLKNSKIGNTNIPAQITFDNESISVYSPIEKRHLSKDEVKNLNIESKFVLERFLRICFCSKVILSAGYFAFGDIFRQFADHESLRKLMNFNISENEQGIKNLPLRIIDNLHKTDDDDKVLVNLLKLICEMIGGSCVIFTFNGENNIVGSIGIGGQYLGSINFNAEVDKFPNENEYRLGHVLVIQDNILYGDSFYNLVSKVNDVLNKNENK